MIRIGPAKARFDDWTFVTGGILWTISYSSSVLVEAYEFVIGWLQ